MLLFILVAENVIRFFNSNFFILASYIPEDWCKDPMRRRAATAANFAASLELARAGKIKLRQSDIFEPIELKLRMD